MHLDEVRMCIYDQPRLYIQKQRHYFANKGSFSQGYGFSSGHVRMWQLDFKEGWALKNWYVWTVWRRLLRVPWTARRSNQSILREIGPGISLEGMMLKLKLQYFGHLRRRVESLQKSLMLGGIGGRRKRGRQDEMPGWHHWLDDVNLSELRGLVMNREAWCAAIHGITKSWERLSNRTELKWISAKEW